MCFSISRSIVLTLRPQWWHNVMLWLMPLRKGNRNSWSMLGRNGTWRLACWKSRLRNARLYYSAPRACCISPSRSWKRVTQPHFYRFVKTIANSGQKLDQWSNPEIKYIIVLLNYISNFHVFLGMDITLTRLLVCSNW